MIKYEYAPIILFVYCRLNHTMLTVDALKSNPESKESVLYIYSDAPASEGDISSVDKVRRYIKTIEGFKEVIICEREKNWGIERSELEGVSEVLKAHGKAIIIEDDIQVSNQFLFYMNYCLKRFEKDKNVYTIAGYSFFKTIAGRDNIFGLTRSFSAWGWATWLDRWYNLKRSVGKADLRYIICHRKKVDNGQDFSYLLVHQYKNNTLTWDVAWYLTCCENNGMTVFPYNTLVNNIGMDGSGVHYKDLQKRNRIEEINDREKIVIPLKFASTAETAKLCLHEKRKVDPKPLRKKIKMTIRFWVDAIYLLIKDPKTIWIFQK